MSINDMTMKQLRERASELQKQLDVTSASANPKEYKALQGQLESVTDRMGDLKNMGKSTLAQMSALPGPIGAVGKATKGLKGAFDMLCANPILGVIAAIVIALKALKDIMMGSDEFATKFAGAMGAVKSIVESFKQIIMQTVGLIKNLFTLNWEGLKDNLDGIADAAKNTGKAARDAYEGALMEDALNDMLGLNEDLIALNDEHIAELNNIMRDTTKTMEERKKAAQEIIATEKENYDMQVQNITGAYDVFKAKNSQFMSEIARTQSDKYKQVEKYMDRMKKGEQLTYEESKKLAQLTSEITASLDKMGENGEEKKKEFRAFFKNINDQARQYNENISRANKTMNQMAAKQDEEEKKAREERRKQWEDAQKKKEQKELKAIDDKLKADVEANNQLFINGKITEEELINLNKDAQKKMLEAKIEHLKKWKLETQDVQAQITAMDVDATKERLKKEDEARKEQEKKTLEGINKYLTEQMKAVELGWNVEFAALDQQLKRQEITETAYNNKRLEMERQMAAEKVDIQTEVVDMYAKQVEAGIDGADKLLETAQNQLEKYTEASAKAIQNQRENTKGAAAEIAEVFGNINFGDSPAQSLVDSMKNAFDEIEKLMSDSEKDWTDWVSGIGSILSGALNSVSEYTDTIYEEQFNSLEAAKAEELAAVAGNAEAKEQIEYEYAQKKLDLEKKQADANAGLQTAQLWVNTAMGVASAWASSMQLGPIAGPIVAAVLTAALLATAGVEQANIIKQRDIIKAQTLESSSISTPQTGTIVSKAGYAEGGYTGNGGKYEAAGVVHRGEYVVAREELAQPRFASMVSSIEKARYERTHGHRTSRGYANGGYVDGGYNMAASVAKLSEAADKLSSTSIRATVNYYEFENAAKDVSRLRQMSSK